MEASRREHAVINSMTHRGSIDPDPDCRYIFQVEQFVANFIPPSPRMVCWDVT